MYSVVSAVPDQRTSSNKGTVVPELGPGMVVLRSEVNNSLIIVNFLNLNFFSQYSEFSANF